MAGPLFLVHSQKERRMSSAGAILDRNRERELSRRPTSLQERYKRASPLMRKTASFTRRWCEEWTRWRWERRDPISEPLRILSAARSAIGMSAQDSNEKNMDWMDTSLRFVSANIDLSSSIEGSAYVFHMTSIASIALCLTASGLKSASWRTCHSKAGTSCFSFSTPTSWSSRFSERW